MIAVVPTMPERSHLAKALREQAAEHPWLRLELSEHASGELDCANALDLGRRMAEEAGDDWFLFMEDDVYLSPRFKAVQRLIPMMVASYGGGVGWASFYSFFRKRRGVTDGWVETRLMASSGDPYGWGAQCVAIALWTMPVDIHEWVAGWFRRNVDKPWRMPPASDLIIEAMAHEAKAGGVTYYPSLVQHRQVGSTRGASLGVMQSPTYRDAFGEVPGETFKRRGAAIPSGQRIPQRIDSREYWRGWSKKGFKGWGAK